MKRTELKLRWDAEKLSFQRGFCGPRYDVIDFKDGEEVLVVEKKDFEILRRNAIKLLNVLEYVYTTIDEDLVGIHRMKIRDGIKKSLREFYEYEDSDIELKVVKECSEEK